MHIAIIGGGIAGVTLAIALHHRNLSVTLYEQAGEFSEVGAGVSFSPNAVQAMRLCHEGIHGAFERVCTRNLWPSKQNVWFDYLDGLSTEGKRQPIRFTISNSLGQNGVHRAHFLDELVKLLPDHVAQFNKRLDTIEKKEADGEDGRLRLSFTDGSFATADLVIGCDGIKSRVRQILLGDAHPAAKPGYTHKYAYRGLVPMEKAVEAIGEELASNACMHIGPKNHMLTFPVNQGKTLNIVAFHSSQDEWKEYPRLTRMGTRDEALADFHAFGENVTRLLKLTDEQLSVWAIFDLADHPVPFFSKDRICIAGDAAHATSPHHGAGAGFCLEDSAVLAALLADGSVRSHAHIKVALAVYDDLRRERAHWLVQSSRFMGNGYQCMADGVGSDLGKLEAEINRRNAIIADFDVEALCRDATAELASRLSSL
ncbi:hypothetical protein ASPZODRAFT_142375 [Penicilliopsis zonata CBS 506.65]|uniref:FAD-binding domain-containing protein n=1 Tax=Penicilliopsis zonata CBS 506.65 TaxID=1073090 RepID=A0A1L9SHF9_9EURO|nr:hypothetical protein ASPZODRAFT_142375 [Penicilliopsis zonata CBS 506.65]OJJ46567.1 hypothetical protein ASPZODRAFT_142375 [Penicilliopsis zonata CBS 506.65]